jgi:AcrR family transcriptional regulator
MAKKPRPSAPPPSRRRRTAEEARASILDAAEQRLVQAGPGGIRLQEVAADVGVSHPTVLHHFGSREALVEAVVARALDSLSTGLLGAVRATTDEEDQTSVLLDAVFDTLVKGGHARAFLWLALSGYAPPMDELRIRAVAEAVHEVRITRRAKKRRSPPVFEDTYFTVLLPALALLAMSVVEPGDGGKDDEPCSPTRFRAWLAGLIHKHLEQG